MKKYGIGLMCLMLFLGITVPKLAKADTVLVSGLIVSDTIWSPPNVYVIDSSFSVPAGITLTIEPGTVIKGKPSGILGLGISGSLIAHGTIESPIYFTSWNDDSLGGDTNGDGPSVGVHGSWQGLYFKPGSHADFDYVNISYTGYGGPYVYNYGHVVGIENDGGDLNIRHSNIHDSYIITSNGAGGSLSQGTGIYNKSGTLSVTDSVIGNNVIGIWIDSGTTTISNSIIKNNIDSTGYGAGYGIYTISSESLTLLNNTFSNNRRTASINSSKNFIHSGNVSYDQTYKGFEINESISEDKTFTSGDLPYIIQSLTIQDGKTLTLETGTILKMDDRYSSGAIHVQGGNLVAHGTPDKKIYITSLKDDLVGGDTNGDGDATSPKPKDWSSIFLENGSKADFDNVTVRYGGYNANGEYFNIAAAMYQRGAQFTVSNSVFEHNATTDIFQDAGTTNITNSELKNSDYAIWSRGGVATISQSSITGHTGLAIYNESGPQIDARNNWWGDESGPNDTSTTTPTGVGDKISGNVLYIPFLGAPPGSTPPPQSINPVIIIPGIMGSAKKNGQLVIDPILHTYDDLIDTFKANGYEEGKDLFTFPYEWRDSNVLSANLLKNKITEVRASCLSANLPDVDCSKVDLIAHSMGGLVAREYIQSGQYRHDVDQVIFLGTPHNGSQKAYLTWEGGVFDKSKTDYELAAFLNAYAFKNGYANIYDYVHNFPIQSIQELLPTVDYLKDKSTGILRTYPNNYPTNTFLEVLNNNVSKLLNSGVRITNIIGDSGENKTIEKIRVVPSTKNGLWQNGEPENFYVPFVTDHGLERGVGDNTVTILGASLDSIDNISTTSPHDKLPTVTENVAFNILTGKVSSTNIDSGFQLSPSILLIQLFSPIDVVVTAPDGKKIGKNFQTGGEYDEIPGAFYSGYNNDDDEYVTIPNPMIGEYKIDVQGVDNGGSYGVTASYISDNTLLSYETGGIIKPGQVTEIAVPIKEGQTKIVAEREITLDDLLGDINGSYDLKWIKDTKTRDALIKEAKTAVYWKTKAGKMVLFVNDTLVRDMLKELDVILQKGRINREAHDLLYKDLRYLMTNY